MTDTGGTDDRNTAGWSTGAPPPAYPAAGGYPAPPPYGGYGPPINNHLAWGIVTTLLCFMPFGIVSIVFASQVNGKQAAGDIAGAMSASKKAKTWAIASAATAAGLFLILLIVFVVAGLGAAASAG